MMKRVIRKEDGFSLLELMITVIVVAILGAAFTAYMYQDSRNRHFTEVRQNVEDVSSAVFHAASRSDSISRTQDLAFGPLAANPPPLEHTVAGGYILGAANTPTPAPSPTCTPASSLPVGPSVPAACAVTAYPTCQSGQVIRWSNGGGTGHSPCGWVCTCP